MTCGKKECYSKMRTQNAELQTKKGRKGAKTKNYKDNLTHK